MATAKGNTEHESSGRARAQTHAFLEKAAKDVAWARDVSPGEEKHVLRIKEILTSAIAGYAEDCKRLDATRNGDRHYEPVIAEVVRLMEAADEAMRQKILGVVLGVLGAGRA